MQPTSAKSDWLALPDDVRGACFDARFDLFMIKAQDHVNASYATFGGLTTPKLSGERGQRYIRIVSTTPGSRSAWGFIDTKTGDVLKSAGWKAPAKNFARGNIFNQDFGLGRASWTGVH